MQHPSNTEISIYIHILPYKENSIKKWARKKSKVGKEKKGNIFTPEIIDFLSIPPSPTHMYRIMYKLTYRVMYSVMYNIVCK